MNPQAVTVGARAGRSLNPILRIGASRSPDRVAWYGGAIASILGGIAGVIGPQTTAQLVRTSLEQLDGKPQLELPPGVRLALAAANEEATLPDVDTRDEQLEAMRRVLSVVAAKANVEADELIRLLDAAIEDVRAGRPPAPPCVATEMPPR